jgi:vancomycin resistance protein VanJ
LRSSKLATLLYSYILFVCIWFLLWLWIGDGPWWLTVINRVVPYLFLPVLLFLPLLLWVRMHRLVAWLILPASIFAFLYHPYMFPRFAEADVSQPDLTVMTYNVLYSNLDYDAVAKVIRTYDPDLVSLQEVMPDMMVALQDRLAKKYPYSVHGTNSDYGVTAVFSQYPLSKERVIHLGEDRRAVIVNAQVNDQTIAFAAVHLRAYGLNWVRPLTAIPQEIVNRTNQQNRQVEILSEELLNEPGPVIIGCDCNSKETSSSYRLLDQLFDSAAYQVGWQFPGKELAGALQDTSLQHIDFIWYRGALKPVGAFEIQDSGGSDHHPILAFFEFQ